MSKPEARAARLIDRLASRRISRAVPALIALTLVFVALALAVHSAPLYTLDVAVTRLAQSVRSPGLDRWAIACTFVGNTVTLITFALLASGLLALRGRRVEAVLVILSLLGLPFSLLLKPVIGRPRPDAETVSIILPALGLSFPSGHAMSAAAFFGWLGYLAWALVPRRSARNGLVAAFVLIAAAVGWSRIYLGAHWLSDVVGGWAGGLFCLVLLAMLHRRLIPGGRRKQENTASVGTR